MPSENAVANLASMNEQFFDPIPIILIPVVFAVIAFALYEVGFRIGRWYQVRTPGEQEGPTGVLVGSLLGLAAFLLAITMGMASDRFDARRGLVLAEANAIGTAFLRAGYLPEPESSALKELFREYVPHRINATDDPAVVQANIVESLRLQDEIWAITEDIARENSSDVVATYIESVNEVIDLHESRVTAGIYGRVPGTIMIILFFGSALTLGMVGYQAGLTLRRSLLSAIVLVVALGGVITIVADLDRPQSGFLRVSQQPLIDLEERVGPPSQ